MTLKTALKSAAAAVVLAVATMHGGTAHAAADDEFKTLSGVEAEPLNAEEMEAVQGKAFLGTRMYGRFLLWYDSEINYPLGFDTRLPAVQGVFAWLQAGAIPRDPNVVINFLIQADPQGLTRFSPIGRLTANGRPCIRGFTVGC